MKGGIYILTTLSQDKPKEMEYRVAHAYDIENIWYTTKGAKYDFVNKEAIRSRFNSAKMFSDRAKAGDYANNLYYRYEMSDPSLINDGISYIFLDENYSTIAGGKKNEEKIQKVQAKRSKVSSANVKSATKRNHGNVSKMPRKLG